MGSDKILISQQSKRDSYWSNETRYIIFVCIGLELGTQREQREHREHRERREHREQKVPNW